MAIKPKHSFKNPAKVAQRFFTDRTEPRELFFNHVDNFDSKPHLLINYYGLGGIGKTRLLKQLAIELKERKKWCSLFLDMEQISFHDCGSGLVELRNQLSRNLPKIKFTSFDFAYAVYWERLNPNLELSEKGIKQLENSDLINDIAKEFVETMDAVPGLNIITKVAKLAKNSSSIFNKWWMKRGNEQHANLGNLPLNDIREWLPAYFSSDIEEYMNGNSAANICLFIDTYEALWDKSSKEGQFFEIDEWIRELVSHLPQVLFVISGREKLRWEELDSDWEDVIDSHILQRLSDKDAALFLKRCSVNDSEITESIIKSSEGSPFYLDLAVDKHNKIIFNGNKPQIEDFKDKTHRQILDRFVRYLDRSESTTLKVLAICRQYDQDLFANIVKEFETGYSSVNMAELNRYSFIQELGLEEFSINPLMKRALVDHLDSSIHKQVTNFLFNYYISKIHDFATEGMTGFKNFQEAKFFAGMLSLEPIYAAEFAMLSGRVYQYQSLMKEALAEFERASSLPHCDPRQVQNARLEIAITQRQDGNVERAIQTLDSVAKVSKEYGFKDIEGKALVQKGLCNFSMAYSVDDPTLFREALELYQKGLEFALLTDDIKQVIYTKITISTVMEELGQIGQACKMLKECQFLSKKNGYEHLYVDCLNGLARKYLKLAEYDKVIELAEEGFSLWQRSNFYRGQLVMCSHLLSSHFYLGHSYSNVSSILEEGDRLDEIVTERLIKGMYKDARNLWLRI